MTVPDVAEIKALLEQEGPGPRVSMYMPTHRAGREVQQDQIRLKNLARTAQEELVAQGLRATEAQELLGEALARVEEPAFWEERGEGLALLLAPGGLMRRYVLPRRVEERVSVGPRFYVVPLVPFLFPDGRFYVLALSQQRLRLVECTRWSAREVDLSSTQVPLSIEEALRYSQPEKQHQFHSDTSAPGPGGRWSAVFHGQGVVDEVKDDLRQYFLQIDRGLKDLLGNDGAPLVLAGVEYLFPLYREVNTYPALVDDGGVPGSPDGLRTEELQARGWSVVEPLLLQERRQDARRYRQLLGTGLASADVEEVAASAFQGRVEVLFVQPEGVAWGLFQPETGRAVAHRERRPGDEDLVNFATVHTLLNGGRVHAESSDGPPDGDSPVAAIYRY